MDKAPARLKRCMDKTEYNLEDDCQLLDKKILTKISTGRMAFSSTSKWSSQADRTSRTYCMVLVCEIFNHQPCRQNKRIHAQSPRVGTSTPIAIMHSSKMCGKHLVGISTSISAAISMSFGLLDLK